MGIPPTFEAADWGDGQGTALAPAAGQAGPAEVQHVQNQEEDEGNEWPRLENPLEKHNWVSIHVIYIILYPILMWKKYPMKVSHELSQQWRKMQQIAH